MHQTPWTITQGARISLSSQIKNYLNIGKITVDTRQMMYKVPEREHNLNSDFARRAERARLEHMVIAPESLYLKPLPEALDLWYEKVKQPTIKKERTKESYRLYIAHLKRELGGLRVSEIHHGHLLEFQRKRHNEQKACPGYVNHETNVMQQLLTYCGLWEYIARHFKALPPSDWRPPKTLSPEMEDKFFKIVSSGPESWRVAYWAVSITNNTSAMGIELRSLQRKHIFLDGNPRMHVPDGKVKNEFRARVIPLNEIAAPMMERLIARAEKLALAQGFTALCPDNYLFPFRIKRNGFDVTRPASRAFIKKPFQQMRAALGEEFSWLQPRNFRNQVITKLFEAGAPDETITAIAGHQSIRMSKYYSSIRFDAKKQALTAILPREKGRTA